MYYEFNATANIDRAIQATVDITYFAFFAYLCGVSATYCWSTTLERLAERQKYTAGIIGRNFADAGFGTAISWSIDSSRYYYHYCTFRYYVLLPFSYNQTGK
jgi:hypothetical protein